MQIKNKTREYVYTYFCFAVALKHLMLILLCHLNNQCELSLQQC